MTRDVGDLYNLKDMSEEDFKREMKKDNLTLPNEEMLLEDEILNGVVSPERIPLVDALSSKNRRVRRKAVKSLRKELRKGL